MGKNGKERAYESEFEAVIVRIALFGGGGISADPSTMKQYLKKADLILIAGLLLCSLAGLLLLDGGAGEVVTVRQNGEILYQGALTEDAEIAVCGAYHNTVVVREGAVFIADADCPGGDCMTQGKISRAGSRIACAPNGVIVTITGAAESEVDAVAG